MLTGLLSNYSIYNRKSQVVKIGKKLYKYRAFVGRVAELAYAYGLGPYAARLGGSSPLSPTKLLCEFSEIRCDRTTSGELPR